MADEGLRRVGCRRRGSRPLSRRHRGPRQEQAATARSWQVSTVRALQDGGMTRPRALAEMLRRYCEHMHANEPVHTWDT